MSDKMHIKMTVNGEEVETLAEPRELLIHVLRERLNICLLYTSPSPRDATLSRMPSSA